MARAFAALQDEQRDFELRPWLFRIAHNEAISILRRRRETAELDDVAGDGRAGGAGLRARGAAAPVARPRRSARPPALRRSSCASSTGSATPRSALVLEISPAAVKQAIFEARSALFTCREGREMACHDVRRMLSDGDGRVLRGRGVRAHLRSCSRLPPLPGRPRAAPGRAADARAAAADRRRRGAARAAARRSDGRKLLACVAIAGGGTTVAASRCHDVPEPPEAAAAEAAREAARGRPRRAPPSRRRAAAGPCPSAPAPGAAKPGRPRKHAEARPRARRARQERGPKPVDGRAGQRRSRPRPSRRSRRSPPRP